MRLTACFSRLAMALTVICLLGLVLVQQVQALGVVAFDYGTDSMKVSLVKPGLPFDVVLDRDSKRRIQSAVSFKKWGADEEILFGTNAYNHATREPKQSFYTLKTLLGRTIADHDEETVQQYSSVFANDVVASDRGTCALKRPYEADSKVSSIPVLTVEELVGMQLEYAKKLAEETAGEKINLSFPSGFNVGSHGGLDAVVTVPAFFNAQERQALIDAASLAGFRPRLVSDGAAAAVNYAQTRTFPQPETHLFYDAGAGSVRATVVEFSTKPVVIDSILSVGKAKEAVIVDVKGVGWERGVGGLALDLLLREKLVAEFDAAHGSAIGGSIKTNARAMARLLKEANRVKHILSANDAARSAIESLVDDIDFKTVLQRSDFEDVVAGNKLTDKFISPIDQALKMAGLALKDVKSVVLVGGSTRVPFVQAALRDAGIADEQLAQNVNADEAAVMGAAFYGASYNPQFRMKEIRAYDMIPYPVNLKEADGQEYTVFPAQAYHNESITREYTNIKDDFVFEIEYDSSAEELLGNADRSISTVEITGIAEALKDLKASEQLDSVDTFVNFTVVSRPLGIYSVENPVMIIKPKPGGFAGALKSFFGGSSKKAASANATDSTNSTTTAEEDEDAGSELPTKDKLVKLNARTIPQTDHIRPMSGDELKKSKDKLWTMGQAAVRKAQREEARNTIESYLYRVRDLLEDEQYTQVSKPSERKAISAKTEELTSWLGEEGDSAETSTLKSKRTSLESLIKPLQIRIDQARLRATAIDLFSKSLDQASDFVTQAKANLTAALQNNESSKYSLTELDAILATLEKDKAWFEKSMTEQKKRSESDDPAILSTDLDSKRKKLTDTIAKIIKRRIAKTRPTKSASASPPAKSQDPETEAPPRHEEL